MKDSRLPCRPVRHIAAILALLLGATHTAQADIGDLAPASPPEPVPAAAPGPSPAQAELAAADAAFARHEPWLGLRHLARLQKLTPDDRELHARRTVQLAELGCLSLATAGIERAGERIDVTDAREIRSRAEAARQTWGGLALAASGSAGPSGLVTLAYADIQDAPIAGSAALSTANLVAQLEYLRSQGFQFLSDRDIAAARRHNQPLPPRAALLLFAGGYASFATRALPILELYGLPAVLALPTARLAGNAPTGSDDGARLTWPDVSTFARHPLVTLAINTHALDTAVASTPQGDTAPAAVTRICTPADGAYETEAAYRGRIAGDLKDALAAFESALGTRTDILAWPAGACSGLTLQLARQLDFGLMFATPQPLTTPARPLPPDVCALLPVTADLTLPAFADRLAQWGTPAPPATTVATAATFDLHAVAATAPADRPAALAALASRAAALGLRRVYLTATGDEDNDGAADVAYFPNRVLPVRADILGHAVRQFQQLGLDTHAVLPVLALQLPDPRPGDTSLLVQHYRWSRVTPTAPPDARLSPFNPAAITAIRSFYDDFAAHVDCDGALLGLDAALRDNEDASPAAARIFVDRAGLRERDPALLDDAQRQKRLELKTAALDDLLAELCRSLRIRRPLMHCARAIAGPVLVYEAAGADYAQDVRTTLAYADGIWVDATPERYHAAAPGDWLDALLANLASDPAVPARTVVALGLTPPGERDWLSRRQWARRVRAAATRGFRHLAYYPDAGPDGPPPAKTVRAMQAAANAVVGRGQE